MTDRVEMRDFNKDRWPVLAAALRSRSLTPATKLAFVALVTGEACRKSGRTEVCYDQVASATAQRPDTIYRALRELVDQGYLIPLEQRRGGGLYTFAARQGNGRSSEISGAESDGHTGKLGHVSASSDADPQISDADPPPPHPPSKELQDPRRDARDPRRCPVERLAEVKPGSHREAEWNAWLTARGWPTVADLGMRLNGGWAMPYTMPPSDQYGIEERVTERFLNWATARMIERREASA